MLLKSEKPQLLSRFVFTRLMFQKEEIGKENQFHLIVLISKFYLCSFVQNAKEVSIYIIILSLNTSDV